ncbi:MAG: diguanylate cyclase [Oscillospiraceae bacterium]
MNEKMKVVALCTTRIYDDYCVKLISALNEELIKRGGRLIVFSTVSDLYYGTVAEHGDAAVFQLMNFSIIDAVVIQSEAIKNKEVLEDIINRTKAAGKQVFYIGKSREDCVNFSFDYTKGFESIVRHVIKKHNVDSIHMIAGVKGNNFSDERIECFKRVLGENGLPFDESMISYGDFWSGPTEKAVNKLISEKRVPRAIICANDSSAIAASLTLKKAGFRIPEDVIVTGFDGIVEARFNDPKITTCECDYDALAESIAYAVYESFEGKELRNEYLCEPRIMLGESCGCGESDTMEICGYINFVNNRYHRFQEDDKRLNRISMSIQSCTEIEQIGKVLDDQTLLYDMVCVVDDDFIDPSLNPGIDDRSDIMSQTAHVIYKSGSTPELRTKMTEFPLKQLYHDFDKLLSSIEAPIVFNVLAFKGSPFGYVCYFYKEGYKDNYAKTLQITMTLCSALSGFRAARYQRYLMEHIEESYRRDSLTGLYNRSGFMKVFSNFKKQCSGTITAILADLDDLKHLNDKYGHDEGDIAIKAVAQALQNSCPDDSVCVRFGGDEMFAVVKGKADNGIRDKINQWLLEFNENSGKPYTVSASVGIFTTSSDDATFEELVRKSDQLMYNEKIAKKIKR